MFAKVVLLTSLLFVGSQSLASNECAAPPPRRPFVGPVDENRVLIQHFAADVGRGLLRKWSEDKFRKVHDMSCLVDFDSEGKVVGFEQTSGSASKDQAKLFKQLITEIKSRPRPLGPFKVARLEIQLQTYTNAIIRDKTNPSPKD